MDTVLHAPLVADAMLYVMNGKAKQFFREFGVEEFTAPYELNAKELSVLGLEDMALPVYGRLPLMVSAQCVKKNTKEECDKMMEPLYLTDRKQKKLPVLNFCCFCYNVVYGYECLSLLGCPEVNDLILRFQCEVIAKRCRGKVIYFRAAKQ